MAFRRHKFERIQLYPSHQQVTDYLRSAGKMHIEKVQFKRRVTSLHKSKNDQAWTVQSVGPTEDSERTEQYDFVLLANGHYDVRRA